MALLDNSIDGQAKVVRELTRTFNIGFFANPFKKAHPNGIGEYWMDQRLLKEIGMRLPIIQAPMAGISTVELARDVTEAGGLGSLSIGAMSVPEARISISRLQENVKGPVNINVFCHKPARVDAARSRAWTEALTPVFRRFDANPPSELREVYMSFLIDTEMQKAILELRPKVVSFHFGLPPLDLVRALKEEGIYLIVTATNLEDAQQGEAAGMDAVVAQGFEAGGHRGIFFPEVLDAQLEVEPLVRLLVQNVKIPIIAAGAIMDGAGIAKCMRFGAAAAQMGTAFVVCKESSADDAYRAALLAPESSQTRMTSVVSGRPARSVMTSMTALEDDLLRGLEVPDYPLAYDATKALAAVARARGDYGFSARWAGKGAALARPMPAAALMSLLESELSDALAG